MKVIGIISLDKFKKPLINIGGPYGAGDGSG
jgi:hypothetical protein